MPLVAIVEEFERGLYSKVEGSLREGTAVDVHAGGRLENLAEEVLWQTAQLHPEYTPFIEQIIPVAKEHLPGYLQGITDYGETSKARMKIKTRERIINRVLGTAISGGLCLTGVGITIGLGIGNRAIIAALGYGGVGIALGSMILGVLIYHVIEVPTDKRRVSLLQQTQHQYVQSIIGLTREYPALPQPQSYQLPSGAQ